MLRRPTHARCARPLTISPIQVEKYPLLVTLKGPPFDVLRAAATLHNPTNRMDMYPGTGKCAALT